MIWKLMKYEFRAMLRAFVPFWCGILVLAIINHFTIQTAFFTEFLGGVLSVLLLTVYILTVLGVGIAAVVFLVLRFYRGLLRNEGYLMFTLPVTTAQLVCAKLISAVALILFTTAVSIVSVILVVIENAAVHQILELLEIMITYSEIRLVSGIMGKLVLILTVCGILAAFGHILHAYLAMSIGQLARRRKIGTSVLSYVGILIVKAGAVLTVLGPVMSKFSNPAELLLNGVLLNSFLWMGFGSVALLEIVSIAVCSVSTWWILQNKLNLE